MTIDLEYYYNGAGPYYSYGGPTLDGNGQVQECINEDTGIGLYEFTGVRDSSVGGGFVPVYAPLRVNSVPPWIGSLGSGGDNWDAIWISGSHFQPEARVYVYSADGAAYQIFWGPAWGYSPGFEESPDGALITLQVTDPTVRNSFGNDGVFVLVVDDVWNPSSWAWTQSPRPVVTSGDAGCDDLRCLWMVGSFPLNAFVDLRAHAQSPVLPNSNSGLSNNGTLITLQLDPSVYYSYDTAGLDANVVNGLFPNWSTGTYFPPKDRSVHGHVDSISLSGYQYYINGWACANTYAGSIDVHVYLGGPAGGGGTYAFAGTANIASEPSISTACQSTGSHFRFSLPIPYATAQQYGGQTIYVHGISPFSLGNPVIDNSGAITIPSVDRSVTGWISGVVVENNQFALKGWACAKTYTPSIVVYLYAGGAAGSGTYVTPATANLTSTDDPSIATQCNSSGTNYRFSIPLTLAMRQQYGGQPLYVHGISPFGLANAAIGNSGTINMPLPVVTSAKEYIYIGDRLLAVDTTNLP